jgi:hypothetical protein
MAEKSIEGQRQESIESFILVFVAIFVIMMFLYYFYEYLWFYPSLAYFFILDLLPNIVIKKLFFWTQDLSGVVSAIYENLLSHRDDFSDYYLENESGISQKSKMDYISFATLTPFIVILFFVTMFRGRIKNKNGIVALGDRRNARNALFAFAKSQSDIWPYIKPVVNIMSEMVKNDNLDNEWYAMSELPISWMKRKGLIKKRTSNMIKKLFTSRQRQEFMLDEKAAYLAVRENLGGLWNGLDGASDQEKLLLAVIIPHIFGKVKMSRLLNRKINYYYESKKGSVEQRTEAADWDALMKEASYIIEVHKDAFITPYFSLTEFDDPFDPLLSSFEELDSEKGMFDKGHDLIQDVLLKHSYKKTVYFALLDRAWVYGILASSELLWVKKVDRDLWYIMSQQGRSSAFVEVCGAWSHYLAEREFGFRTLMPQISEGLRGLDYDLWSTHDNYLPVETWDDQAKWDRLVPDFDAGNDNTFGKPQSTANSFGVI